MVAIYQTIITLERARPMKDDQGDDWVIPNKKTSTLIFHLYNFIIDDHLILFPFFHIIYILHTKCIAVKTTTTIKYCKFCRFLTSNILQ